MQKLILSLLFLLLNYCITGQVVKVTSGATFTLRDNITVAFDNLNLEFDGPLQCWWNYDNKVIFSGNQTTTIDGSVSLTFPKMEIAKTNGAELKLLCDIATTGGGDIYFTSGLFNLNNHNIYLPPYADLGIESETSHIYGPNGGYIQKQVIVIGRSINHGNLGLIFNSPPINGYDVYIRRGHQSQPVPTAGKSISRYYDIINQNGGSLGSG